MKKIFTISLALAFLVVSSGILLEINHFMGLIADADLSIMDTNDKEHCGNCGMEKSNSGRYCCKDEYKHLKISRHHLMIAHPSGWAILYI